MNFPVRAITLDLDDTLWPFAPIGARIEQVLHDWMREHSPATAAMYPVAAMRELVKNIEAMKQLQTTAALPSEERYRAEMADEEKPLSDAAIAEWNRRSKTKP